MKKSIIAMLSITAFTMVANAESFTGCTGTPFEGMQVGGAFYAGVNESGTYESGPYFWYASTNWQDDVAIANTDTQFGTYTNSTDLGTYDGDRPEVANGIATTNKCLWVETDGERLFRKIGKLDNLDGGVNAFKSYDITSESTIYFDSLVQFTVTEDEPEIQEGDKLAVWLKGDEATGKTNLVVTAGYLDMNKSPSPLTSTNYVTDANVQPGTWYRLTIEAYNLLENKDGTSVIRENQGGILGFRVRINGIVLKSDSVGDIVDDISGVSAIVDDVGTTTQKAINYAKDKELFLSLVSNEEKTAGLSCVAFEGTGAIDDITFTSTNPFDDTPPTPENPTVDGETVEPDAVFETATTAKPIVYPSAPDLNGVVGSQTITYNNVTVNVPEYYTATLEGTRITLELNDNALPTIAAATIDNEERAAIEVTDTKFVTTLIGTNNKLYYGLKVATSPNATDSDWMAGTLTQGTGTAMQISANKPKSSDDSDPASAGFFKVYVTDIAPSAE